MGKKKEKKSKNPEIDLLTVFDRIGDFFEWIKTLLFGIIHFFVKNAIVVVVLIILGFGLGLLIAKVAPRFEQKIIVAPNFKSTDYLYSKIDLLSSKISSNDTLFLKSIGIQKPSEMVSITIEPIVDVTNLMNGNEKNTELLELMAQNGDLKSIIKETTTNKNFTLHTIVLNTSSLVSSQNIVEPLLKYLNASPYYEAYNRINSQNIQNSIKRKEETILQIDGILNQFSGTYGKLSSNEKLVYYNENMNLDEVIKTKDSLANEINKLKIEQYNTSKTIKEKGIILNAKNTKTIKEKLIFTLPLVFVGLFVLYSFCISFYKKQSLKTI
ncbi:hypothetical protein [Flavobacterium gilvum]|uniref:Uncharacterized protein n=1 Tax=Flavobacterium gilvum TaxID=1492737 RepID=A0AAC9I1Z9_9FLAO|nr:hypothetical protein [Flavobacterium gilvum]AOW08704.1 hypothetical protein EM308_03860 [Flavobacterium gilvum]KFC59863.1 hypothetical protein FEM08_13740 [Flavobacterium gilvum]